tara:strand:+ start:503 stop:1147 length:645 start_codon:yes stop_codon:yes gene_type:complete
MRHFTVISALIALILMSTGCAWISTSDESASNGINVNGHWAITVTNAEGTVDTFREFDNEITNLGKSTLIALLTGQTSFHDFGDNSPWMIMLDVVEKDTGLDLGLENFKHQFCLAIPTSMVLTKFEYTNYNMGDSFTLSATCKVQLPPDKDTGKTYSINTVYTVPLIEYPVFAKSGETIEGPDFEPKFTRHDLVEPVDFQNGHALSFNILISVN